VRWRLGSLIACALVVSPVHGIPARRQPVGAIAIFGVGHAFGDSAPNITVGPDGNLWFTETHAIGRITPSGHVSTFAVPRRTSGGPVDITSGSDGNLWFADTSFGPRAGSHPKPGQYDPSVFADGGIGRITPKGQITEFRLSGDSSAGSPQRIISGGDGNLWFVQSEAIGRITRQGTITEYPSGTASPGDLASITSGPDGNVWFTDQATGMIGRIRTTGQVDEFRVASAPPPGSTTTTGRPEQIIVGPDRNLWFINGNAVLGRLSTSGQELPSVPTGDVFPASFTTTRDGSVWCTDLSGVIAMLGPDGHIRELMPKLPRESSPGGVTVGPDRNIWFTFTTGVGKSATGGVARLTTGLGLR
jgi:streptogramin lyase